MSDGKYLVWSNEHRCWWRPNSAGYTLHVKSAGRYSREEALSIARGSRRGWVEGRAPDEMAIAERDVLDAACLADPVSTPSNPGGK